MRIYDKMAANSAQYSYYARYKPEHLDQKAEGKDSNIFVKLQINPKRIGLNNDPKNGGLADKKVIEHSRLF